MKNKPLKRALIIRTFLNTFGAGSITFTFLRLSKMSWKKSLFYFAWQSIRYAENWPHFQKMWSFYPAWRASFAPGKNSVSEEQAWLTFGAIEFLEKNLDKVARVFEYGGGGSTLFFIKRAGFVATVENDRDWFAVLSEKVREKGFQKWEGHFMDGELIAPNAARSPAVPADFRSNAPGQENLSYERYAKAICQYPKNSFDVVLVDGRARPSCIQESLPYLKAGGFLVVDNMERDYYWTAFREVFKKDFKIVVGERFPVPFHPDFTKTVVFEKL